LTGIHRALFSVARVFQYVLVVFAIAILPPHCATEP
jgi:hypothetical protein